MFRVMILACLSALGACVPESVPPEGAPAAPLGVQVVRSGDGFALERDGQPYFIRGAGGKGSQALLVKLGANSIRTWGAERLGDVLDAAHRDGLSVTAGIWLEHSTVFDYRDAERVAKQKAMCREVIDKHKDHPALLMWAFGNEMEGYGEGDDPAVWSAVNDIAAMSKRLDPNHPTMTVIAEIGGRRVPNIERLCPAIDVVGINSYGGAPSLSERYRKAGGTKPYVVTEFGPLGPWERPKTAWGAPLEPTSTEKAAHYRVSYEAAVAGAPGRCLGSYAFLWGYKQETTATWFGMLLKDGARLEAADGMAELWTGRPPANRCPRIGALRVSKTEGLEPGGTVTATLEASDPEGDPLEVRWMLSCEVSKYLSAGQDEAVPPDFPDAVSNARPGSATLTMPPSPGAYRVFVTVYDGRGGAATANVPLFVGKW